MWYLVELPGRDQVEKFLAFSNRLGKQPSDAIQMAQGTTVFEIELSTEEKDSLREEVPPARIYPSSNVSN